MVQRANAFSLKGAHYFGAEQISSVQSKLFCPFPAFPGVPAKGGQTPASSYYFGPFGQTSLGSMPDPNLFGQIYLPPGAKAPRRTLTWDPMVDPTALHEPWKPVRHEVKL